MGRINRRTKHYFQSFTSPQIKFLHVQYTLNTALFRNDYNCILLKYTHKTTLSKPKLSYPLINIFHIQISHTICLPMHSSTTYYNISNTNVPHNITLCYFTIFYRNFIYRFNHKLFYLPTSIFL